MRTQYVLDQNEKMMLEKCPPRVVETKYGAAMRMLNKKRKPLPLRNEAPLNCVLLRSRSSMQHGRKQARFHGNTDKTGGYCGSTELPVVAPERS